MSSGLQAPVGEVAVEGDLVSTEDADVEVPAAHHGEGVGVVEYAAPGSPSPGPCRRW
jgi:hypothetical protein